MSWTTHEMTKMNVGRQREVIQVLFFRHYLYKLITKMLGYVLLHSLNTLNTYWNHQPPEYKRTFDSTCCRTCCSTDTGTLFFFCFLTLLKVFDSLIIVFVIGFSSSKTENMQALFWQILLSVCLVCGILFLEENFQGTCHKFKTILLHIVQ